ncbi:MAG: Gfo/Idh/MocA family oxidoreductase [Candidatus Symbiothrix sp.]|jgi:virulence factor|nr:Gfo/Idh/MocA family oxidoreductase [Candidatus Symbiothrix sp.]
MYDLINLYKRIRKKHGIHKDYRSKYAFVGIGNHSLHNLYPVIDFLHIPLKYIVSKSLSSKDLINRSFPSVTGTNDYDEVLNDPEINGIFICATPSVHYELTKKALAANKNVFTEKPVCLTSQDLQDLIDTLKNSSATCLVGMQKRFSISTSLLKKKLKKQHIISYFYRFQIGAYPEGNVFRDIFIHPVDYVLFLFGNAEVVSALKTQQDDGRQSVMLQLRHPENVIGAVEISTQYAWSQSKEVLSINTEEGMFEMENHQVLTYSPKPLSILSMPVEKVFPQVPETQYLFNGNNFLPVFQNNQLVSQGYFGEIQSFTDICENKSSRNISSLESLKATYKILEIIQK